MSKTKRDTRRILKKNKARIRKPKKKTERDLLEEKNNAFARKLAKKLKSRKKLNLKTSTDGETLEQKKTRRKALEEKNNKLFRKLKKRLDAKKKKPKLGRDKNNRLYIPESDFKEMLKEKNSGYEGML